MYAFDICCVRASSSFLSWAYACVRSKSSFRSCCSVERRSFSLRISSRFSLGHASLNAPSNAIRFWSSSSRRRSRRHCNGQGCSTRSSRPWRSASGLDELLAFRGDTRLRLGVTAELDWCSIFAEGLELTEVVASGAGRGSHLVMEASKVHGIAVIGPPSAAAAGVFGAAPPVDGVTNSSSVSSMTELRRALVGFGLGVRVRARWIVPGLSALGWSVTGGSFLGEPTGVRTGCCTAGREGDVGGLAGDNVRFRRVGDGDFGPGDRALLSGGSTVVALRRPERAPLTPGLLVAEDLGATGVLSSSSRSGNSSSSSVSKTPLISLLFRFFALAVRGSGLEAHVSFQSRTSAPNRTESEDAAASSAVISMIESSSSSGRSGVSSGVGFGSRPARESGDSCCLIGRAEDGSADR